MAKRKFYRQIYKKRKKQKIFLILKFSVFCVIFFIFCSLCLFLYYAKDLPRPEKFTEKRLFESTKIYDRTGKILLYDIYGEEKRKIVPLTVIPEYLKQAVIATEDASFYKHSGIDYKAIIRAALINLKLWQAAQGGSTIPQQLIRSSFLTNEKTIKRKIKEIILTLELDRRYSKDQILEWYLNQIPFGSNCYGVEAASRTFFGKPVSEISLAEAATLSALIKAPSSLSPYGSRKQELLYRKDYVLRRMFQEHFITEEQMKEAKQEKITFIEILNPIKAPHFTFYVKEWLENKYGNNYLEQKGLRVFTSLDWKLQDWAEKVIKEEAEVNKKYNAYNASLTALDPKTGEILAMVGSKDWFGEPFPKDCKGKECLFQPKFNVALKGERQPGSAFKPFAFATAFKKGYRPETILWDVETNFSTGETKPYTPQNYDGKFRGLINFRKALAQSINVPSVKVLYLAGEESTIETAKDLGITTLNKPASHYGLSLVLGGGAVKLLDMVSAYGVFAANGLKIPPVSILKIEDSQGNVIWQNKKTAKRILNSQIAMLINDILSDNKARTAMFGPRSLLYFQDYSVAAKTGTTQEYKDAWTIGYTPSIVVGVWVGNNNNTSMAPQPGVVLAGPIFHRFMEKALLKYPKMNFEKPEPSSISKPILSGKIKEEDLLSDPHCILHYIEKNNPLGEIPKDPQKDFQYLNWEKAVKSYLSNP